MLDQSPSKTSSSHCAFSTMRLPANPSTDTIRQRFLHSIRDACSEWMGQEQLEKKSSCDGGIQLNPDQNVAKFMSLLVNALRADLPPAVTFALDGLSFSVWKQGVAYPNDILLPVTSVVPSTSTTAWSSILSGTLPSEHGILGAAFLVSAAEGCYSLRHSIRYSADIAVPCTFNEPLIYFTNANLFATLKDLGYACQYRGQPRYATESRFLRDLAYCADLIPLENADHLHFSPCELVEEIIKQTRTALTSTERPLYQFNMVNFDSYVHCHGYDDSLFEALVLLRQEIDSLLRQFPEVCISGISDHGMIRQACRSNKSILSDTSVLQMSRYNPGGAGRILFFYPRPEAYADLWNLLSERIGNDGILFTRETFLTKYIGSTSEEVASRVGDIVAIAQTDAFPSALPSALFEHGGLSTDEMMAGMCFFGAPEK